jgi:uncharacterized repeat protein (TIGR03803 family)
LAIAVVFALTVVPLAQAQKPATSVAWPEKVLFSFNGTDGSGPTADLIFDAAGNLYGTAGGGEYGAGTVFELTPTAGGGWTETVLHNFGNGTDGAYPSGGLVFDAAGNLYGTTPDGGTYSCFGGGGCGTVFELTPTAGGGWAEQVLYSFGSGTDGTAPYGALVFDAAGDLYGTTSEGGTYSCFGGGGCGTVFELTPAAGGSWTEQVLHNFNGVTDGYQPVAGLIFDAAGNLYGTTAGGGPGGTVFELTPTGDGNWTEEVLHTFGIGTDGAVPTAALVFDAAGNLYGTTYHGGTNNSCVYTGCGTVFELTYSGGTWWYQVLHNFGSGSDGYWPQANLIVDAAGNLYSTTFQGGTHGEGTVFEVTPGSGGRWTEQVLHSFNGADGYWPWAGLIFDAAGNLYGTTNRGGAYEAGTIFELMPIRPCAKCSH